MHQHKLNMPVAIQSWIAEQAAIMDCSMSYAAEVMIRNGMAAHIKLEEAIASGDPAAQLAFGNVAYRSFSGLNRKFDKEDAYVIESLSDIAPDLDAHITGVRKSQTDMEKMPTTVSLTEDLTEFLRLVADRHRATMTVIISMYLQAAIMARFWNDDIGVPVEHAEEVRHMLKEHLLHYVDFERKDGVLHVFIEKKTRGPMMPVEQILNMNKKKGLQIAVRKPQTHAPRKGRNGVDTL